MKSNKAFTLIEVIGVVIILGILAIITVPLFTKNLEGFREDFYINMESNIVNSGKEFFSDNRKYRPNGYLEASKVTIATLMGQNYIDDIIDYEGTECDKESYVIVIRKGKDEYDYHACLKCPSDNFDNTEGNKYCNSAWTIPTTDYTLGEIDDIYIYKGTSRNDLIEKTKIPVDIIKYDEDGNVLDEVSGDGADNVPYITPVNLDTIDTNKEGEYVTEYEFQGEDDGDPTTDDKVTKTGKVIVYENKAPIISITKTNNVYNGSGNSDVTTDYGTGGTWAQKVTVTFNRGDGKYDETGTNVSKYQWKRGEKWIDFCTTVDSAGKCVITIGKTSNATIGNEHDMNEDVKFRIIDTEGNVSVVSPDYRFMIDNTNPECTVTLPAFTGTNGWYITDVNITLTGMKDIVGIDNNAISGIKYYTLDTSQVAARTVTTTTNGIGHGTISGVQNTDTSGVTWYGFIEDNAQNYMVCQSSVQVKRDTVAPGATWNPTATDHDNSDGIDVTAICTDSLSGPTTPVHSISEHISSPTSSSGTTLSISCTDIAGNSATLSKTYKVRKYYSNNCDKCGASTCTSSSCCGTYSCHCSTSCVCWDYANDYVCGSGSYSTGKQCSCDVNCTTTCDSCASTCTSSCCGCESCWSY